MLTALVTRVTGIGQVRQEHDLTGHFGGRGAAVEADGIARLYHGGRRPGDPGLLIGHPRGAVAQRRFGGCGVGDRAAAGAGDQLLVRQVVEIASRGRRRDAQTRDDVVDMDTALVHDDIEDGRMAIMPRHLDPPGARGAVRGRGVGRAALEHDT